MKIDESSLTGESDHVPKAVEKDPMLLSGKSLVYYCTACINLNSVDVYITHNGLCSKTV